MEDEAETSAESRSRFAAECSETATSHALMRDTNSSAFDPLRNLIGWLHKATGADVDKAFTGDELVCV